MCREETATDTILRLAQTLQVNELGRVLSALGLQHERLREEEAARSRQQSSRGGLEDFRRELSAMDGRKLQQYAEEQQLDHRDLQAAMAGRFFASDGSVRRGEPREAIVSLLLAQYEERVRRDNGASVHWAAPESTPEPPRAPSASEHSLSEELSTARQRSRARSPAPRERRAAAPTTSAYQHGRTNSALAAAGSPAVGSPTPRSPTARSPTPRGGKAPQRRLPGGRTFSEQERKRLTFEQLAELPWYLATAGAGGAQRYFYDRTSELFYDNGALPAGEAWALPQELEALVRHLPSIPLAALRNS